MDLQTYVLFLITTFTVIASPGAAAILAASQGAANGFGRAISGVLGIASANAVYFALSATGLASLMLGSDLAFQTVKWAGVIYLFWLGFQAIFSKAGGIQIKTRASRPRHRLFAHGFVIEFANPKALMYFAAILPQFLDPTHPLPPQILIMGGTTFAADCAIYGAYAFLGHHLTRRGVRPAVVSIINKFAGAALIFVGARMVLLSTP